MTFQLTVSQSFGFKTQILRYVFLILVLELALLQLHLNKQAPFLRLGLAI